MNLPQSLDVLLSGKTDAGAPSYPNGIHWPFPYSEFCTTLRCGLDHESHMSLISDLTKANYIALGYPVLDNPA